MANRRFESAGQSLEAGPVHLWARVAIGAAGAPTLTRGKGFASVSRTGTGAYTFTLSDKYQQLLDAHVDVMRAGYYTGVKADLDSETVSTDKEVKVGCYDAAGSGTAWDPISGSVMFLKLVVRNSRV